MCQLVDGENVKKATKRMKSLVKKLAKCTKDLEQDQKKLNAAIRELTKCVTKCKTHFNMTTDQIIKLTPEGVEASLGETTPFKMNQAKKAAAGLTKASEAHQDAYDTHTTTQSSFDVATTEHAECDRQLKKGPCELAIQTHLNDEFCPVNSEIEIRERDTICIPSSCLEGAGEDNETGFKLGIEPVAEAAGKWVPFVKDGVY